MEYILGEKPKECIFCSFPGRKTYREDLVLVVQPFAFVCLNKYPFAPAHVLVVPRRHVSNLEDLADEEYSALMALVRDSARAVKKAVRPEGMNIGFNLGHAAGAGIAEHLHAHAVPRWVGDSNFMPVIAGTRVMPEYLDQTWAKLRVVFDSVPGEKAPLP
jgi:ATP adenylyltransferase